MKIKINDNAGGRNYVSPKSFPLSLNMEGILCVSTGTLHEGFSMQELPADVFNWEQQL